MDILGNVRKGNQKSGGDNTMKSLADLMRLQLQMQKAQPDERDEKIKDLEMQIKEIQYKKAEYEFNSIGENLVKTAEEKAKKNQAELNKRFSDATGLNKHEHDEMVKRMDEKKQETAFMFIQSSKNIKDAFVKYQLENNITSSDLNKNLSTYIDNFAVQSGLTKSQDYAIYMNFMAGLDEQKMNITKSYVNQTPAAYLGVDQTLRDISELGEDNSFPMRPGESAYKYAKRLALYHNSPEIVGSMGMPEHSIEDITEALNSGDAIDKELLPKYSDTYYKTHGGLLRPAPEGMEFPNIMSGNRPGLTSTKKDTTAKEKPIPAAEYLKDPNFKLRDKKDLEDWYSKTKEGTEGIPLNTKEYAESYPMVKALFDKDNDIVPEKPGNQIFDNTIKKLSSEKVDPSKPVKNLVRNTKIITKVGKNAIEKIKGNNKKMLDALSVENALKKFGGK